MGSKEDAFQWGIWRLEKAQHLKDFNGEALGYSPNGELLKSIVPPGGAATIHIFMKKIHFPLYHGNLLLYKKDRAF